LFYLENKGIKIYEVKSVKNLNNTLIIEIYRPFLKTKN